ncbi:MAG: hypothetical protein LBS12_00170 [Prevotellaceae bacterium]|jgi:heme O synthase-like polyprenyltransferase|nr:hypothetical protein [Prevotellaceae bacterium]
MKKHLLYIIILIAFICLVLVQQHLLPTYAYIALAGGLGTYFWPVKFILDAIRKKGAKAILTSLWSNYLYSYVLACPVMVIFLGDMSLFRTIAVVAAVANALTGFAYHFFHVDDEKARLHFIMGLFSCTWFGGAC